MFKTLGVDSKRIMKLDTRLCYVMRPFPAANVGGVIDAEQQWLSLNFSILAIFK